MKKFLLALALIGMGVFSSCEKSKEELLVPEKHAHGDWHDWPEYWSPREAK